jgi:hypothetical protein
MSIAFEIEDNEVNFVVIGKPRKAFVYEDGERTNKRVRTLSGSEASRIDVAVSLYDEPQGQGTLEAPDQVLEKLSFGVAYRPKGGGEIGIFPKDRYSLTIKLSVDDVQQLAPSK